MKTPRTWYAFKNAGDDASTAEIHITDFIGDWIDDYWGFGVTAKAFLKTLAELPEAVKTIRVRINSPGGDVFGAVNIANALREQQASKGRTVETIVDGLAASAASIILMAGSKVTIADNALVMIHNPWSVGIGNADEMRKVAETLDTVRAAIIATYKWHSQLDEKALAKLMDDETWMDADEAIANGFATDKMQGLQAAASIDPQAIADLKVPEKFRDRVKAFLQPPPAAPAKASALEVVKACNGGGCPELAEELLAAGVTGEQLQAKVAAKKTETAASATRATAITALCAASKIPELADSYIKGGMSVDAIKAQLTIVTAKIDGTEIDASLNPDGSQARGASATATPGLNAAAIFAARRQTVTPL